MKGAKIKGLLLLIPIVTASIGVVLLLQNEHKSVVRPKTKTVNGITVGISKNRYAEGERVIFWMKNERKDVVNLPSKPPWHIEKHTNQGWQIVYQPLSLTVVVKLKPNETRRWTWNQYILGNYSSIGLFRVVIPCWVQDWSATLNLPFTIVASPA